MSSLNVIFFFLIEGKKRKEVLDFGRNKSSQKEDSFSSSGGRESISHL